MATHLANEPAGFTAFSAGRRLAQGELQKVVKTTKEMLEKASVGEVLIFDDRTGTQVDVDLHGPLAVILKHLPGFDTLSSGSQAAESPAPRPGRPKLGVVPREVTLLPRHWEWLNAQPGGASVTLRKLVEEARRAGENHGRRAQEACYRFMMAAAGNLPGFEEAARALFADDVATYEKAIQEWPQDLREYALSLLKGPAPAAT